MVITNYQLQINAIANPKFLSTRFSLGIYYIYFIIYLRGPLDFLAPIVPGTRINSSHSFVVESLNGRLLTGRFDFTLYFFY